MSEQTTTTTTEAGKTTTTAPPDHGAAIAALQAQIAELTKAAKTTTTTTDLGDKTRQERELNETRAKERKDMEKALKFTMSSPDFLKVNESILPKDIPEFFKQADKETYGSVTEKANAIKSQVIQSFFAQQANIDLLTPSQKEQLDDYLKLTKTVKQDKATEIYDSLFEPAFEMMKRIRKAEAISKGHGNSADADNAYKQRMIERSRKHYLGEKN